VEVRRERSERKRQSGTQGTCGKNKAERSAAEDDDTEAEIDVKESHRGESTRELKAVPARYEKYCREMLWRRASSGAAKGSRVPWRLRRKRHVEILSALIDSQGGELSRIALDGILEFLSQQPFHSRSCGRSLRERDQKLGDVHIVGFAFKTAIHVNSHGSMHHVTDDGAGRRRD